MYGFKVCEIPIILQIIYFIKILINLIKFIVPMGLIIMVSLDLGKGVISGEKEAGKILKASSNRILAAIIIFLIPTIVDFSVGLVDKFTSYESCWGNANTNTIKEKQVLWDEAVAKREEERKKEQEEQRREEEEAIKKEEEEAIKKEEESKKEEDFISSSDNITFTYEFIDDGIHMPYALYTPSTVKNNKTTPLIVWLHGSGEVGVSKDVFKNRGLLKVLNEWTLDRFNAYVLCPQLAGIAYSSTWNNSKTKDILFTLIDYIMDEKNINKNKIILVGHSLGGTGVLYMGYHKQEYFSALVVLSGYNPGGSVNVSEITIPVRGYNGSGDSQYMSSIFKRTFGSENYFSLVAVHGKVPELAFTGDENKDNKSDLVEWMLSQ